MLYDEGRVSAASATELMMLKNLEELYQCGLREIETEVGSYLLPA
jgi:iron complex transport system ATP-binding protein